MKACSKYVYWEGEEDCLLLEGLLPPRIRGISYMSFVSKQEERSYGGRSYSPAAFGDRSLLFRKTTDPQ